jgi:hypothetical protein
MYIQHSPSRNRAIFIFSFSLRKRSQDSSVSIATAWTAGFRFSAGTRDFSLLHSVRTGSGAHLASYPIEEACSLRVKRPGREAERSPRPDSENKNGRAIFPHPLTSSWRGASTGTILPLPYQTYDS